MKDYYSLEITFPQIDFDNYSIKRKNVADFHHAHLSISDDEIELKIFYETETLFGEKIANWTQEINWNIFGTFIKISKENQNERLQRIDLTHSILLGLKNGSAQFENNKKFVIINLDSAKLYWNSVETEVNNAEFYFDNSGFKVVKDFYGPLFGWDGKFNINRMKGMDTYYPIGKGEFRPEFSFSFTDNKGNNQAVITKNPKLQFRYKNTINENEAVLYGEIVCLLASFFFHTKISFTRSIIHLPEHTITIMKVQKMNYFETSSGLNGFKNHWNFHKFMQSNWQPKTLLNFKTLSKIIELFNQSHLVDSNSKFLIRFNIIEICNGGKINDKFTFVLKGKSRKKKCDEALKLLLETISPEEHPEFSKKWEGLSLTVKPMKNPILSFFESQNLDPSSLPIKVEEIKKLRNNITHGSIDEINYELLRKTNILLYRITGIIILNMMGIDEWELNRDLN